MTKKDLYKLYTHLGKVLTSRLTGDQMTPEQRVFYVAFEDATFGASLTEAYADFAEVHQEAPPSILHSFIMGHAIGVKMIADYEEEQPTTH